MLQSLTYPQFHALFVVPPLVLLAGVTVCRYRSREVAWRQWVGVFVAVAAMAVLYTTPWDNFLIERGVWYYGTGRVAARIVRAPVSEYLFFVLQPAVTALWLAQLPGAGRAPDVDWSRRDALLGLVTGVAVGAVGLTLARADATFYLGAILAWAGPVLALQWAVGWRALWRVRGLVATAVAVPTAYFAAADSVALTQGIWVVADRYTVGLAVGPVPVEEVAFFLVTNLFVVQGLVLYPWVVERWGSAVPDRDRERDRERGPEGVSTTERWRSRIVERWR